MTLNTKRDMLEAQAKGALGNFLATYPISQANLLEDSPYYTIQSRERDSPNFIPVIRGTDIAKALADFEAKGVDIQTLYIRDIPDPNTERIIQGEVFQGDSGRLYLFYTTGGNLNLRDDLKSRGSELEGLRASIALSHYLTPTELVNLEELLDKYPGNVCEFTVFSRPTGALNSRLVIWEMRNY